MEHERVMENRVVAIVQARLGSTRLPGKILFDIGGQPLLARVLERVQACETIDEVIVATSESAPDDAVAWFAERHDVRSIRGSETDVLARYHTAVSSTNADTVVRLTSDNPFIATEVVDKVVTKQIKTGSDYCSTEFEDTFPKGIGCEAFTPASLETVHKEASSERDREHVTTYYRANANRFETASVTSAEVYERSELRNRTDLNLTIDTPSDYAFMTELFKRFDADATVPFAEVIEFLDAASLSRSDI